MNISSRKIEIIFVSYLEFLLQMLNTNASDDRHDNPFKLFYWMGYVLEE